MKAEDKKYSDREDEGLKNGWEYYRIGTMGSDYEKNGKICKNSEVPEDVKEWFGENHKYGKASDFIRENKIYL